MTPRLRLRVYGPDGTGEALGTIDMSRSRSGHRRLNDLGRGEFTLDLQHSAQFALLRKERVVRWELWDESGQEWQPPFHASIVEEDPPVLWVPESEGEPGLHVSGPTLTGWLERAVIYPDPDLETGESVRLFGWMAPSYDPDASLVHSWPEPGSKGRFHAAGIGLAPEWPDELAEWIGTGDKNYLLRRIDTTAAPQAHGPATMFVTGEGRFTAWWDGHPVGEGLRGEIVQRQIEIRDTDNHRWAIESEDAVVGVIILHGEQGVSDGTVVYRTFTEAVFGSGFQPEKWRGEQDPATRPGETVGRILSTLFHEVAGVGEDPGRGGLQGMMLGFTATHDSDDVPWPENVNFGLRTKATIYWAARQLHPFGCDFEVGPDGTWDAWVSRGADLTATVTLTPPTTGGPDDPGDFFRYRSNGPAIVGNALLFETEGGFGDATEGGSISAIGARIEAGAEIGTGIDAESMQGAIETQLSESAWPAREHTVDLTHAGAARLPGLVELGDEVTGWVLDDDGVRVERDVRVLQLSFAQEDEAGAVRRSLVVRSDGQA